mgnify:CR=1 FL=1
MLNLFQIADACQGLLPIVKMLRNVLSIVQIFIPILLILFGTIDLGKAVISSDEKEIKAAQSRLVKRCIYAAAVFFVVLLVTVVMNIVASSGEDSANTGGWKKCWNAAGKKK